MNCHLPEAPDDGLTAVGFPRDSRIITQQGGKLPPHAPWVDAGTTGAGGVVVGGVVVGGIVVGGAVVGGTVDVVELVVELVVVEVTAMEVVDAF